MDVEITIDDAGDLVVTADREMLEDVAATCSDYWGRLHSVFEPYSANGSYAVFDAGSANPFVGLTDAPCVAEEMDVLDDGTHVIVGRLWWYPGYELADPWTDLEETGRTVFTAAPKMEG